MQSHKKHTHITHELIGLISNRNLPSHAVPSQPIRLLFRLHISNKHTKHTHTHLPSTRTWRHRCSLCLVCIFSFIDYLNQHFSNSWMRIYIHIYIFLHIPLPHGRTDFAIALRVLFHRAVRIRLLPSSSRKLCAPKCSTSRKLFFILIYTTRSLYRNLRKTFFFPI